MRAQRARDFAADAGSRSRVARSRIGPLPLLARAPSGISMLFLGATGTASDAGRPAVIIISCRRAVMITPRARR